MDELLHEAAFGEATPMGSSQFADNLSNLTPESVLSYRQHQYTANNLVIASSGLSHDILKSYTDKYLNDLSSSNSTNNVSASSYVGGDAKLKGDYNGKTYVALAFPTENKNKAYNVLRVILHNKLNRVLDMTSGEISCFNAPYSKGGLWGMYSCGSTSGITNKLIESAVKELKVLGANVPAAELETAKNQVCEYFYDFIIL